MPDIKKEMQKRWKEVDEKIAKYGEMEEEEVQAVIEKYRSEKRARSKGA